MECYEIVGGTQGYLKAVGQVNDMVIKAGPWKRTAVQPTEIAPSAFN